MWQWVLSLGVLVVVLRYLYGHPGVQAKITQTKKRVITWVIGKIGMKVIGEGMEVLRQSMLGLAQQREATLRGNVMTIPYTFKGAEYELLVPYHRRWIRTVLLTATSNGTLRDINHHPCLPFLVSADDIGCDSIRVHLPYVDSQVQETKVYEGRHPVRMPGQIPTPTHES